MQDRKQNSRFSLAWIAGLVGVVILVGGGTAWWAKQSLNKTDNLVNPSKTGSKTEQIEPNQTDKNSQKPSIEEQQRKLEIAWLDTSGTSVKVVSKTKSFPKSADKKVVLEDAFKQLLTGPENATEYTTTIPEGTQLMDLEVTPEGVKVNLSQQFVTGGGSASMSSRLAQVIYTASSLNGDTPIWINVEGKPLENLGGEGVTISQPMTRQEFDNNFKL